MTWIWQDETTQPSVLRRAWRVACGVLEVVALLLVAAASIVVLRWFL